MKLISLILVGVVVINGAFSAPSADKDVAPQISNLIISEGKLPDWEAPNITMENHHLIRERMDSEQALINNVAYRGDAITDYLVGLRQMNLFMRQNYKEMMDHVGHNVYPLIVATDVDHDKRLAGVGSEYILFLRNGTIRHMKPTPMQYEQNKNLAHLALSIFTIISPYFNNPTSVMWHDKLNELRKFVSTNLDSIKLPSTQKRLKTNHVFCEKNLTTEDHKDMLTLVLNYINKCFESKSVDIEGYKNFSTTYLPFIEKAMTCAVQIQTKAGMIELNKWKEGLGKEWSDLYVIIPVVWPVARVNPRQLIFEKIMDKDKIATHILKAEGAQSIEEARTTAGRIIADRTMAHFVFGKSPNHIDCNLSLSTRRDLLATKANETLNTISKPIEPVLRTSGDTVIYFSLDQEVEPNNIHFQNEYP